MNQILNALSELKFDTFVDVGAAEGYTANLVKHFFNADVEVSDLSEEACKNAGDEPVREGHHTDN